MFDFSLKKYRFDFFFYRTDSVLYRFDFVSLLFGFKKIYIFCFSFLFMYFFSLFCTTVVFKRYFFSALECFRFCLELKKKHKKKKFVSVFCFCSILQDKKNCFSVTGFCTAEKKKLFQFYRLLKLFSKLCL